MTRKKREERKLQQWRQMKQRLEYTLTYAGMNYPPDSICSELRRMGHLCNPDEILFYLEFLDAHKGEKLTDITNSMYRLLWEEEPPQIPAEEQIEAIKPEYKPVQEYQSRALFLYLLTCRMEMMRHLWEKHPEKFERAGWEREWVEVGFDSEYVRVMYGVLTDENNKDKTITELSEKAYRILYVGKRKIYNSSTGTGKMYSCDVSDIKVIQLECKTWCEEKVKQWLKDIETEEENRKKKEENNDTGN